MVVSISFCTSAHTSKKLKYSYCLSSKPQVQYCRLSAYIHSCLVIYYHCSRSWGRIKAPHEAQLEIK